MTKRQKYEPKVQLCFGHKLFYCIDKVTTPTQITKSMESLFGVNHATYSYVCAFVKLFIEKGLIERVETGDKRTLSVRLTEKGKEVRDGLEKAIKPFGLQ